MQKELIGTIIGDAMIDYALPIVNPDDFRYLLCGGVTQTRATITPGGATNVATVLSTLGSPSAFIGKIGNDNHGECVRQDLIKHRVLPKLSVSDELPTGKVFNLVLPDGQRFFLVERGANSNLLVGDIDEDTCLNSNIVYLSGYSFQDNITKSSIRNLANDISQDVKILFNPGAPNLCEKYKEEFLNLIRNHVDIVILNGDEAFALTGCSEGGAIQELLSLGIDTCAVTMGVEGSIVASSFEVLTIAADLIVNPIDTTGAGDAYAAAFIHGLQYGWNLKKVGGFASKIAADMVKVYGTRSSPKIMRPLR